MRGQRQELLAAVPSRWSRALSQAPGSGQRILIEAGSADQRTAGDQLALEAHFGGVADCPSGGSRSSVASPGRMYIAYKSAPSGPATARCFSSPVAKPCPSK